MHASIGAASSHDIDIVSGQYRQCGLQTILYTATIALTLPAAKAAAVIFEAQG
jgi:hypothetical protein